MTATPVVPAWRHQAAGREFAHRLWGTGQRGAMLAMTMGCVAGDEEIIVNRAGGARRYKLRDLYHKFHGHRWNPNIECRTSSLINGELHLNRIINVIDQGIRPVLKIQLASGKSIRVTANHEIATPNGWIAAADLQPGSEVLTNGIPACRLCGGTIRVITYRYAKHRGLCRSCAWKRAKPRTKIGIVDKDGYVRLYGKWDHPRHNAAGQVYEHILVMEEVLHRPIARKENVHHKNGIKHDNRPENLEVMPVAEHHRHHGQNGGYLHLDSAEICFIPKVDVITKIEPDGESDVYDLAMNEPGHNFVVNGVIVHNSGKTRLAIDLINDLEAPFPLIVCPVRVVEIWRQQFQKYSAADYEFAALDDRFQSVRDKWAHARDMRAWAIARQQKLVTCINYESARVEPFASWALKIPWPAVVADECVPPGSMISTPAGDVAIENLCEGDAVYGYDHATNSIVETSITATFRRETINPLLDIHGARLTPEHPVWTANRGYIPARLLRANDEVLIAPQEQENPSAHLSILRTKLSGRPKDATVLQQKLPIKGHAKHAPGPIAILSSYASNDFAAGCTREAPLASGVRSESLLQTREQSQGSRKAENGRLPHVERRQWAWPDRAAVPASVPAGMAHGMDHSHTCEEEFRLPESLQDRYCRAEPSDCDRGGRPNSPFSEGSRTGRQERRLSALAGMAGAALLERGDSQRSGWSGEARVVHNLETKTANYFVNGLLVHNCHRVKDGNGRTSRWLARLGRCARYRLGLTGTPMPHSPLDIWGQFRFLDPSILDLTFGSFKQRHAVMGGYKNKEIVGWRDLDLLYADFRKIAYQVDEKALELPDAIDETLECDFSDEGRRIYAEMENEMVAWIRDMDGKGVEVTAANSMVRLTRLQQITGGSLPDDQGRPAIVDCAKENLLADFLADVGQEPVVVFAVYKADLAAIRRAAEANGLKWAEVSGARDQLAEWKRGAPDDATVLAVQIQSGGEGIDLTRARLAVYYSHGFSLAQYKQSRSRIWRPPQSRPCAFYHLQVRHSIDQYVLRAVLARQDLVEGVLKGLRRS